ncbi:MAG: GNAT family N-acetyltransferase [Planctomycetota bacterium]|nr:GNAT family N-acetyltransferase [Planctomycetota bacterium]
MSMEASPGAIVFATPRLDLRPMATEDLAGLTKLFADERAMRNQCRLGDQEEARAYIERHQDFYDEHGFGQLTILERVSGKYVGKCGFSSLVIEDYREFILSHLIDPPFEMDDYDVEALEAMITFAFDDLDFMRVVSLVKPFNRRIERILKELGMSSEKEVVWDKNTYKLYVIHNT